MDYFTLNGVALQATCKNCKALSEKRDLLAQDEKQEVLGITDSA
jgi:hypothetical protein